MNTSFESCSPNNIGLLPVRIPEKFNGTFKNHNRMFVLGEVKCGIGPKPDRALVYRVAADEDSAGTDNCVLDSARGGENRPIISGGA